MSNAAVRWVETELETKRVRMPDALADRQSTRFIWQAREDTPHAEVLGGMIERCRVMPVIKTLRWDRIADVPLEFREVGMLRKDHEGKTAYAAYGILPGFIFDAIMEQYRGHGVVELTALRGMDAARFAALKIDEVFFPEQKSVDDGVDQTPQTYGEMRRSIQLAIIEVRNNRDYSAQQIAVLETCANEMLRAINVAERYDNALADESEGELELGRNNPQYKQKYDASDLAALRRVGRPRKDAFMKRLAEQQFDLQTTIKEAIVEKSQASNVQEIAQAVGIAVASEFTKLFAAQRGIPIGDAPVVDKPTATGAIEESNAQTPKPPKPAAQPKQPTFQKTE